MKNLKIQGRGKNLFFVCWGLTIPLPQNARILNGFGKGIPHIMDEGREKKFCTRCNRWIAVCYFHKANSSTPDGLMHYCPDCINQRALVRRRKRNPFTPKNLLPNYRMADKCCFNCKNSNFLTVYKGNCQILNKFKEERGGEEKGISVRTSISIYKVCDLWEAQND